MNSDDFLHSVVGIIIFNKGNENRLLFQKRAKNISQGGEVSFPGGKIDNNEASIDAVYREIAEETGINADSLILIKQLPLYVNPTGILITAFLFYSTIKSSEGLAFNKSEVEYLFDTPLSFFTENKPEKYSIQIRAFSRYENHKGEMLDHLPVLKLGLPESYRDSWGSRLFDVFVYKYKDEVIWGITARLISEAVSYFDKFSDNLKDITHLRDDSSIMQTF